MTKRRLSVLLLAAVLTSACNSDGGTGVNVGPKTDVTLNFCLEGFSFTWIGIQNQGEGWKQITASPAGVVSFQATEKVSIALVINFLGSSITQVLNSTAAELNGASGTACVQSFGNRTLRGGVAGFSGEQIVELTAALAFKTIFAGETTWQLANLPSTGTVDLVATRHPSSFAPTADRIIIRRALTPTIAGLQVPMLDFAAEGQALETSSVTFANVGNDFLDVMSDFSTSSETFHTLGRFSLSAPPYVISNVSVPAALRVASDLHSLLAGTSSNEGGREIVHFYKTPAAKTLTFGPMVTAPSITQVATTPYRRLRAQVTSQAEYGSGMSVDFFQQVGESGIKLVSVATTANHVGGTRPTTWDITMPDFGNSGYQASWGLGSGAYDWSVEGINSSTGNPIFDSPVDGMTITTATRNSPTSFTCSPASPCARRTESLRRRPWLQGARRPNG